MEHHRRIVLETLALLEARGGLRMDRVYARLFARAPETQALFIGDMGAQMGLFATLIRAIAMDGVAAHADTLRALGRRHDAAGVEPDDHAMLRLALTDELADSLGCDWTPGRALAFRSLYVETMRAMRADAAMVGGERLELPTSSV